MAGVVGLASGPRNAVAGFLIWAGVVSANDAFAFHASTTHFNAAYHVAWELFPPGVWVAFFAAFAVASTSAGVRLLLRRSVHLPLLVAVLALWGVACAVFGFSLVHTAGLPGGLTGASKWATCTVGAAVSGVVAVHNGRLSRRIETVMDWIGEDFTLTEAESP